MSLVCVCADVGASGQVLSTARGTLDAAGGQRGGAFYLAAQNVLMLAQLLQTCCVNCNM